MRKILIKEAKRRTKIKLFRLFTEEVDKFLWIGSKLIVSIFFVASFASPTPTLFCGRSFIFEHNRG